MSPTPSRRHAWTWDIAIIGIVLAVTGLIAPAIGGVTRTRAVEPVIPVAADPLAWGLPASSTEVLAKRVKDAKHFRNADGSYTAIFGKNVHYEASPGVWDDVDLTLRESGPDHIVEKNKVKVKVSSAGVSVWDRDTGKGIRWSTTGKPAVSGRKASFSDQGLTWEYATRKSGVKFSATVSTTRGPQTYTFRYTQLGGSADFTVDDDGNLVSDEFTVPRAFAVGADGEQYQAGVWQILPGQRVSFDFDDTGIPLPYELDPTTTFNVAATGDDGQVERQGPSYPPSSFYVVDTTATTFKVVKSEYDGENYILTVGLARWDTSSIDESATVTAATFRFWVTNRASLQARDITAEWYAGTNWPIGTADWTSTVGTDAHAGTAITSLTIGSDNDLALANPSNVVKDGYTGLRLHVSGGSPGVSGANEVTIAAYDHATLTEPRLLVTYNTPPSAPTWTDPAASDTLVGTETLAATTTDADSDNWYATFEVHSDSGYTALVRTITGSTVASGGSSTNTWDTTLDANGTYYLRAKATDTGSAVSGWTNLGAVTVANFNALLLGGD